MTLPRPEPGLVIRYSYLWLREYREGREEGVKDRPCTMVLAVVDTEGGTRVTVLPIPAAGVEIPAETKKRLGLDPERSRVIVSEGNEFTWPGPDLRPVPARDLSSVAYGFLPPRLLAVIRDRFLALSRQRKAQRVTRAGERTARRVPPDVGAAAAAEALSGGKFSAALRNRGKPAIRQYRGVPRAGGEAS